MRKISLLVLGIVALTVNATVQSSADMGEPFLNEDSFRSFFKIHVESDSMWRHCDLELYANKDTGGKVSLECKHYFSKRRTFRAERQLGREEAEKIRKLLREANFYYGKHWGSDPRNADGSLERISFMDGNRAGTITRSGNNTFKQGARLKLSRFLRALHTELAKLAANKAGTEQEK